MERWGDLFSPRQALTLGTLACELSELPVKAEAEVGLATAVLTCLAFALDRCADKFATQVIWHSGGEFVDHVFARQAIPITWKFAEANIFSDIGWNGAVEWVCRVIEANQAPTVSSGVVEQASSTQLPLPDEAVSALVTDPPYYYSVPYSHLSDFFFVWLRRTLRTVFPALFDGVATRKAEECVQNLPHADYVNEQKDRSFYESKMAECLAEASRVTAPGGVAVVVFAHTDTEAWESLVAALISAGWSTTASWPIDTEMTTRLLAKRQSTLSSSVHLVCRPRLDESVGDWRDVLARLPLRIHEWMPRLAQEGVVGADAIFACLGPALEIYSRYARVEKATGEPVTLREYLEQVWAAVAKEALSMILRGGDAAGFEEDARLSVIWFWVLKSANGEKPDVASSSDANEAEEAGSEEEDGKRAKPSGWQMEYDAVRKLAQGLGADLGRLSKAGGIISISGNVAVLRTVESRQFSLLGVDRAKKVVEPPKVETEETLFGPQPKAAKKAKRVRKPKEPTVTMKAVENRREALTDEPTELPGLFAGIEDTRTLMQRMAESGTTVLDRLHQSMLLFGLSQTALLGPFLTETRMGSDVRFWRLAQALSALYPAGTEEKRWVDGVLARKKGLGF